MIPLYDNVPTKRFPVMTVALIVANLWAFIYELSLGQSGLNEFIYRAGTIPYEYLHRVDIAPHDVVPFWLTWFTAMFLHGGWLHIVFNMLFLWIFGNNVEDAMGRFKFLAFYVLCGLAAAMAQIAVQPSERIPAIGASGAIAGVLGAYIVLQPRAKVLSVLIIIIFIQLVWVPAWVLLIVWFALQLIDGLASLGATSQGGGIAYFEHIGGFVFGLLLVFAFVPAVRVRLRRGRRGPDDGPPSGPPSLPGDDRPAGLVWDPRGEPPQLPPPQTMAVGAP